MRHLDLFTGIGGFALAALRVWGDEYEPVAFCERDSYCQALLKLRFPNVRIFDDIKTLDGTALANVDLLGRVHGEPEKQSAKRRHKAQRQLIASIESSAIPENPLGLGRSHGEHGEKGSTLRGLGESGSRNGDGVHLLTGGFPCQPFSHAGKREGRNDERALWPEMFRVIRETHPTWVIGENVRGLLSIEQGMAFEQVCLDLESIGYEVQPFVIPACAVDAPHRRDRVWIVAKRENVGLQYAVTPKSGGGSAAERIEEPIAGGYPWDEDWRTIAVATCDVRMDDGLPARMDGLELSKSRHRVERLKGLGNAIVPAVATVIMQAIKESDERNL